MQQANGNGTPMHVHHRDQPRSANDQRSHETSVQDLRARLPRGLPRRMGRRARMLNIDLQKRRQRSDLHRIEIQIATGRRPMFRTKPAQCQRGHRRDYDETASQTRTPQEKIAPRAQEAPQRHLVGSEQRTEVRREDAFRRIGRKEPQDGQLVGSLVERKQGTRTQTRQTRTQVPPSQAPPRTQERHLQLKFRTEEQFLVGQPQQRTHEGTQRQFRTEEQLYLG